MATLTPKTSINSAVQQKTQFQAFVKSDAVLKNISETLGNATKAQRFVASVISAVSTNPSLQKCYAPTIISAALLGESLDLSPSPQLGHYYMVPFEQKQKIDKQTGEITQQAMSVATFQLGYKGYVQLAIRSGRYKHINVIAIKEGEFISYNPLTEELRVEMIEDEYEREKLPTNGYYAMFELVNGFVKTMYWSKRKMMAHAEKYSAAFKFNGGAESLRKLENGEIPEKELWNYSSFWFKDFDGMAFKTMLRQLISKWGIMSIELQSAYTNDMAFKDEKGQVSYIESEENIPIVTPAVIENEAEPEPTQQHTEPVKNEQPSLL